jgi:hypothetical protein
MIVIPMAGLSRRFTEAGYTLPKYMLSAHGKTLFDHAVESFAALFTSEPFLFISRDVAGTPAFVEASCRRLGIRSHRCITLDGPTAGQADTVAIGLERAAVPDDAPVTIFNIDTFRPGYRYPAEIAADGYLEVFHGEGANWSYVRPAADGSGRVLETTEKVPISDLCCTGLYHFRSAGLYRSSFRDFAASEARTLGLTELYVAPMYNRLIRAGADIRYHLIARNAVIFCGVPAEYDAFLATGA